MIFIPAEEARRNAAFDEAFLDEPRIATGDSRFEA